MTDGTMLTIGGGALLFVLLGILGGIVRPSDAEVAKRRKRKAARAERNAARKESALERRALRPARWWEFRKKRDQAVYYGTARPRTGSYEESAELRAGAHSLDRLCARERERVARRRKLWAVFLTAAAVVAGVRVAFTVEPALISRVFDDWGEPVATLLGGVVMLGVGESRRRWGGVSALLIIGGRVLTIYGLLLTINVVFLWNGWVL